MALKVSANNANKARNRVVGVIIALLVVVFVSILTAISAAENKKTITVVRLKGDTPIAANTMITEDMVESYDMYYKEYQQYGTMKFSDGSTRSTIVTWEDRDLIIGQRYAAYDLRGGTVLFWDSTIKDQTKKNSYLYSMSGELLNINMNTVSDFGDMVVPGDTLNIRATYSKTNYDLTDEESYKLAYANGGNITSVETTVIEPLFEEVAILDMLNSNGNSIFDIYYDYISMSKADQAAALANKDFLSSVKPSSILLEVTSEEVEHYMEMQSAGATYQITLLPRSSSSSIIDSLNDIQDAIKGISN